MKCTRLTVALAIVLVSSGLRGAHAQAWQCPHASMKSSELDGRRWAADAFPLRIDVTEAARDALPGVDQVLQRAMERWNDVPCAAISLVRSGSAPHVVVDVTAAIEVPDGTPPVYGYTQHADDDPDFYSHAALILNLESLSTDSACSALDLQGLITHELGHVLGLGHSAVAPATMSGSVDGDAIFELSRLFADDVDAICALYPCPGGDDCGTLDVGVDWRGAFADGSCAADLDCPPPHTCTREGSADACLTRCGLPDVIDGAHGLATEGLSCSRSDDCGGPFDFCVDAALPVCRRFDPFCEAATYVSVEGDEVPQCVAPAPEPRSPRRDCSTSPAPAGAWAVMAAMLAARRRRAVAHTTPSQGSGRA